VSEHVSKSNSESSENPLLVDCGLPRFDRIEPEDIVPAVRQLLRDANERLSRIEQAASPSWETTIAPLEELDRLFERTWRPVKHLFGVKNSDALRQAYETVLPDVVQFGLRVRQSRAIYQALRKMREGDGWGQLDATRRRIVEKRLLAAELSGVGLKSSERERFTAIEQELSQLSTEFANHVLDATKAFELVLTDPADVEGLPESLRRLAADSYNAARRSETSGAQATPEQGPWRFTLEAPSYGPFMKHCRRRELRERMYRAFITRATSGELNNEPLIDRILQLRHEKARLLGYATFAELSLTTKMADSVAAVESMLEQLRKASWPAAQQDLQAFQQLATQQGFDQPLAHWDVPFWAERLREEQLEYTDEQLRPYFPLERVLEGLFELAGKLFGIRIEQTDDTVPVWHPDVRFFRVFDQSDAELAGFYLDPYSRPENKRGGAWMDECISRRRVGGRLQLPVAHLVCNATPPVGEVPALLSFREVETLFHEFGHGLQHMLTTVDEPDAAGISGIEWDAVELPSQFMENWCYHRPTIRAISSHYQTGEPLPDDLLEKLRASRTFAAGTQMLRQLLFALTDLHLHHSYQPGGPETPFDVMRRISERTAVLPLLPEDRFLCAFQHIFAGGYAAGYYSYKWAEVLSADAFAAFEEAGLEDEHAVVEVGRRFRGTVLALGGSRHPLDVFRAFRGRNPDPTALLRQYGLA